LNPGRVGRGVGNGFFQKTTLSRGGGDMTKIGVGSGTTGYGVCDSRTFRMRGWEKKPLRTDGRVSDRHKISDRPSELKSLKMKKGESWADLARFVGKRRNRRALCARARSASQLGMDQ